MRHNRQPLWRKKLLFKRGGSSGGGGGAATSTETKASSSTFGRATIDEMYDAFNIHWEKELNEMNDAAAGIENKYSKVDPELLGDSKYIATMVSGNAFPENSIGIKDSKGNIQAAATYALEKGHLYINYLATAPWNFTSDSRAVRGAGTKAIIEAIKLEKQRGGKGEIQLYALDRAIPFYKKLGFKAKSSSLIDENKLKLSAEDANKLLEKFGEAS
jgi:hypothetical protein